MTVRLIVYMVKNNRSCFARTMGGYFCVLESCFLEIYNVIQKQFVVNCFLMQKFKKSVKENHKPFKEIYIHL